MPIFKNNSPEWEDISLVSQTEIHPPDTSNTIASYQERLLHSLLEKNLQEFNDLTKHEIINMNYFYGAPFNGNLLDIACRARGMGEFVKIILQKEVDGKAINEITGKAPIHEAIENSAFDVVEVLIQYHRSTKTKNSSLISIKDGKQNKMGDLYLHITEDRCIINLEDRDGNTPLHSAIKRNDLQIIKLLLENNYQQIDINISNKWNPTPLHIALLEGYTEAAILLLKYPNIDLDFQTDSQGRTCRQIIQQSYPELNEELLIDPTRYAGDPAKILFSLLKRGETELLIDLASKMNTKFLDDCEDCKLGGTLLQHACFHGYVDVVDMLLRKGVNPNKNAFVDTDFCMHSPIMITATKGYYDIFIKLLNHPEIELHVAKGGSLLHVIIDSMVSEENHEKSQHAKCLEFLLNEVIPQAKLDIDYMDEEGNTALHCAVQFNDENVIKFLIYAGAHLYRKNSKGEVPLTSIKPYIIEDYLDDCISSRFADVFVKFYEIIFDYSIFVKPQSEGYETEFFTIIERVPELQQLLKHPVSNSFLHAKWYLVRKYYYTNFVFNFIFCLILSWYIFRIHRGTWSPIINDSPIFDTSFSNEDYTLHYGPSIIYIFNVIMFVRELCQLCVSPKCYGKSPENFVELLVIGTTFFFLRSVKEFNADEQSPISACVIISSWIQLIFLIGKHPLFSIYIEMFKTVASNFFKYSSVYFLLILSFSFGFYILFKTQTQPNNTSFENETSTSAESTIEFWSDPKLSFLKTIIMLTGEFSAETIPLGPTFASRHLFFILFIFLNTIVLYNLLNGLAISDIQAIREDAELVALVSRVKLISQLEGLAMLNPCRYMYHFVPRRFSYPRRWLLSIGELYTSFYNTLFPQKVTVYPDTKIYVLPYISNISSFHSTVPEIDEIDWKRVFEMPSSIVKQAMQILDNRKEFNAVDNTTDSLQVHAVKKHPLKFQSIDKLGQHFTTQLHDLKIEIEEKDIEREEKLIQNVSNLMIDLEFKINKVESNIDKRIENLMAIIIKGFKNKNTVRARQGARKKRRSNAK